ncbi:tRNA(Ile)-lysidine synthase [uncultured archaeon]|nr:tRNA(Ile)-lysidine synthase [uncultured archaeon]
MDHLKRDALKRSIAEKERLLVAFSGGVDSSLLAKLAHDVLGDNAECILLDSETLPQSELQYAQNLARSLDLNFRIIKYSIFDFKPFLENTADRCYYCRKRSAQLLKSLAAEKGISCIADGVNLSDCSDFRPGIQASNEEGIWHPFLEAKISKQEIRDMAKAMGLAFYCKPSYACLSTRIPYGERITKESLVLVERSEDILKRMGFGQLRVRAHGQMARIEIPDQDMERAFGCREAIVRELKDAGFKYVTLDLEGFRSGSMNEVL